MFNTSFSNKTQYLLIFFGFFLFYWLTPGSMHLGLGRTRVNAFRFGSDPVRPIWVGLNPASPARSLAQASDSAGQSNTRVNSRVLLHYSSELKFT